MIDPVISMVVHNDEPEYVKQEDDGFVWVAEVFAVAGPTGLLVAPDDVSRDDVEKLRRRYLELHSGLARHSCP